MSHWLVSVTSSEPYTSAASATQHAASTAGECANMRMSVDSRPMAPPCASASLLSLLHQARRENISSVCTRLEHGVARTDDEVASRS